MSLESLIRIVPHHPRPGIMFRDITTLLADADGFAAAIEAMAERHGRGANGPIDKIAAVEARGFIIGAPLACRMGVGFVPVRKKGKLPAATLSRDYQLEYGSDTIEIHADAIMAGERVLLVDDLLATGGTAAATAALIEQAGGVVAACSFLVDLPDVGGRALLEGKGYTVHALCTFTGE